MSYLKQPLRWKEIKTITETGSRKHGRFSSTSNNLKNEGIQNQLIKYVREQKNQEPFVDQQYKTEGQVDEQEKSNN